MKAEEKKVLVAELRALAGRIEGGAVIQTLKPEIRSIAGKLADAVGVNQMMKGMLLSALK